MFKVTKVQNGTDSMQRVGIMGKITVVIEDNTTNTPLCYMNLVVCKNDGGQIYLQKNYGIKTAKDGRKFYDVTLTDQMVSQIMNSAKLFASENNVKTSFFTGVAQTTPTSNDDDLL